MSWSNPSSEEAQENYYYYKNRYNNAASQKNSYYRQECNYTSERNSCNSQINAVRSEKMNFEKRLEGLERIIGMLESGSVPDAIEKANRSVSNAAESLSKSIRLTGGGAGCNLQEAFTIKTVGEDVHASKALEVFKAERNRVNEEIRTLASRLAALTDQLNDLNSKIRTCSEMQASLRKTMNSCAYEMDHYKKYMDY